jgi:hypothetical protein
MDPVLGGATASPESFAALEADLNSFSPEMRARALSQLAALTRQGEAPQAPGADVANMHCHTFCSFNAYGHSPASLAWLAKRRGWTAAGIVDFDVLDGVDEFLAACDTLGVRGSAGIETRVYLPEFATREINSPGEPGIAYHMGIGFTSSQAPSGVAHIQAGMRQRAAQRNREMVERVNRFLAPVAVDYERDVLPLTPAGNATERHILAAYVTAAERIVPDPAAFWAEKLALPVDEIQKLMGIPAGFQSTARMKLMKRGGIGYAQPGPESFPTVDVVNAFIIACGALPCCAWLDGLSAGEQAMEELLELLIGQGVVALNLVPDRNWNITDPEMRRRKLQKLREVVRIAERLSLPLNVGTEMNAPGQKLVDDFDAPELADLRPAFLDGAFFIYGHTRLQRALGLGYQSAWARDWLPTRRERNVFYSSAGRSILPGEAGRRQLQGCDPSMAPADILARCRA